jgi:hypothetical protein
MPLPVMQEYKYISQGDWNVPVSLLTSGYRERVLQLATTSHTSESWQTTQHLLDQLWMDQNERPLATSGYAVVYGCQECGAVINPGFERTSLRVKRLAKTASRTLRRRHQRKVKKLALLQQKQAKDPNRRKQKEEENSHETKTILLQNDPDLIFDGHHLVIRCGRCRANVRVKGLKREPQAQKAAAKHPQKATAKGSAPLKAVPQKSSATDSMDFVQLPPPSKRAPPPLGQQGPKRKPKKPHAAKSKLLNFLSSLND